MKLVNKTIVISGGGSGIGLEMAQQMQILGNQVIVIGRSQTKLDKVRAENPDIEIVAGDISSSNGVREIAQKLQQFAPIDVLVNNAGQMKELDLTAATDDLERFTSEIDTNFRGTVQMVAALLPELQKRPEALVVNVSSGLRALPTANTPLYNGTKIAVHYYTQSLRKQLKATNVHVLELVPPLVETNLMAGGTPKNAGPIMQPTILVKHLLRGIERNKNEVVPGMSKVLRFAGWIIPNASL